MVLYRMGCKGLGYGGNYMAWGLNPESALSNEEGVVMNKMAAMAAVSAGNWTLQQLLFLETLKAGK